MGFPPPKFASLAAAAPKLTCLLNGRLAAGPLRQQGAPRMKNTYPSHEDASRDKANLNLLLEALNASPSALRRDENGLWILRGRPGCYVSTWGDGASWQLAVVPKQEISALQWTWFKKRLAFCELTQDGDSEGCLRLHRLPTPAEAEIIREILGIRKRVEYSPEELARRQEQGKRLAVS
jgi:hypothetical protein